MEAVTRKRVLELVGWLNQFTIINSFFYRHPMEIQFKVTDEAVEELKLPKSGVTKVMWSQITFVEGTYVLDGVMPQGLRVRCWYEPGKTPSRIEVSIRS